MKTIALWSRNHKTSARILIGLCHIIIFCLALYVGIGLKQNNFIMYPWLFIVFVGIYLLMKLLFSKKYSLLPFFKRKVLSGFVVLTSFMLVVSFSNQNDPFQYSTYNSLHGSFDTEKKAKVVKTNIKELKKQFKEFKKSVKEGKVTVVGVLLAILAAGILGYFVAAASCSLACNGQDALAILVLLGGLTAIFFICKLIIKATSKKIRTGS